MYQKTSVIAQDQPELFRETYCSSSDPFGTFQHSQCANYRDSGVPRNFFRGGGSTNSVEDRRQREWGSGGGSPLVRGSGGSCNLVQEISFHMVKFS